MSHDDVRAAFADAIPEVWDNVISIVAVAGVVGEHIKVSVRSSDPHQDPVGACMGLGGRRIIPIIQRLGGVIDVIGWPEGLEAQVASALRPCRAARIEIGEEGSSDTDNSAVVVIDVVYDGTPVLLEAEAEVDLHLALTSALIGRPVRRQGSLRPGTASAV